MISNRQLFLKNMAQTSEAPLMLEIERSEGVYLYDVDGRSYIDLISGISVSNVGHCHPKVVEAVQHQASRYMHTMVYGEFVLSPQARLAGFLTSRLPERLNNAYFVNSGAEATEGAMKVAKRFTGRSGMISCKNAYHGSTHGALSILGDEYFKRNYRPLLPDTTLIEYNNFEDLALIDNGTAAVFMEVVQAEAGIILPVKGYLEAVRKRCDETGALLVFDEIQTGCGRTGKLFAFEHSGVEPDIILLAKGLGGGMPIGVFITSKDIMSVITENPVLGHITTFGGHPVSCAAALATLQVIEENGLMKDVGDKAEIFRSRLSGHKAVSDIRNSGLMMALELKDPESVQRVIGHCLEHGIVTDWFLFASNCVRIAPPLIIGTDEINTACSVILEALDLLPQ